MSYKPKQFHVRGFDVRNSFDSRGFMNAQPTFTESVERTQHQATVKLLATDDFAVMANPLYMAGFAGFVSSGRGIDEIKLKIVTGVSVLGKRERERIFKMLVAWAEKSRIRGKRGWRASAVKEIRWERDADTGYFAGFTTVLLGTQVFYSHDGNLTMASTASPIDAADFVNDIENLTKEIGRAVPISHGYAENKGLKHSVLL